MSAAVDSPEAPAQKEKSWVWHATPESLAQGKVSVLACAETVVAVALYWGIAIKWDTHQHLLSSIFVAPLLLLRSPESMRLGVRWFLSGSFGKKMHVSWSQKKRLIWLGGVAVTMGVAAYGFSVWLSDLWLVGKTGLDFLGLSALVGLLALMPAVAFTVVLAMALGESLDLWHGIRRAHAVVVGGVVAVAVAVGGAFWGAFVIVLVTVFVIVMEGGARGRLVFVEGLLVPLIPFGLAVRALVLRIGATLAKLPKGFLRMAENWKENNFTIDSYIPAELMPGIRDDHKNFASDKMIALLKHEDDLKFKWFVGPLIIGVLFLPSLIYRLNIKATSWFWWPLAYLLKPTPKADRTSQQKQALCWPWDNRMQNLVILVPAVLVVVVLICDYFNLAALATLKDTAAVPVPLKLMLGMEWSYLPPWHWALLLAQVAAFGMLWIAGNASSHKRNGNWQSYTQGGMRRDLVLMEGLTRVRSLAAKAFMLLGLGMCLISFPEWRKHLPEPILHRLEKFYHTQELREQERLKHRATEELDALPKAKAVP